MPASRRIGVRSSETRAQLLDTAEQIMTEEGYPAVTTRRLASRMGVSNQLIHYYFRTMDDLFLSVLRHRAERNTKQLIEALTSDDPLRELWKLHSDPNTARLHVEFMALINHRKAIAKEGARNSEHARALEAEAISRLISEAGFSAEEFPATGIAMIMSAIPRIMMIETTLGISLGHAEATAFVERLLKLFKEGRHRKQEMFRKLPRIGARPGKKKKRQS